MRMLSMSWRGSMHARSRRLLTTRNPSVLHVGCTEFAHVGCARWTPPDLCPQTGQRARQSHRLNAGRPRPRRRHVLTVDLAELPSLVFQRLHYG